MQMQAVQKTMSDWRLDPMSIVERELLAEKNAPRPYDLNDPTEVRRLLREVSGYLHACRREHHGTDFSGRMYAIDALDAIAKDEPKCRALAAAIAAGA
jgi:hypothetical protein